MKKSIFIFFILMVFCLVHYTIRAQTTLTSYVVGNGAAVITNSNHNLSATFGQPIIGNTGNTLNTGKIGFWYQYSQTITNVEDRWMYEVPKQFELHQNYPNPFNPTTVIRYGIPKESSVKVIVYNILGQQIAKLAEDEYATGLHHITWDGKSAYGKSVSTGVYFYRIKTNDFVETKKMVLLK